MRLHRYNAFLSTQLSFHDIDEIIGSESHQQLINHFKDRSDKMIRPAVFEAEEELNSKAHNMAMNSHVVCNQSNSYDVIVYTCDGTQPYRKGNYFVRNGKSYLAYTGVVDIEDYDLTSMKSLKDVIADCSQSV